MNVKQTTYSKYELGKINIPIEVFMKLADYYDVSVDYLLGRSKYKKWQFPSDRSSRVNGTGRDWSNSK